VPTWGHHSSDEVISEISYALRMAWGRGGAGASQSAVWGAGARQYPEEGDLGDSAGYYRQADAETAQKLLSFTVNDARAG
jgi:hypothetical protein